MAFALTGYQIYGVEAEEVVNKRYQQRAILSITGLNTDIVLDLGNFSGTFWTAVSGTEPGLSALKAFKDIQIRALSYMSVGGSSIGGYSQADASAVAISSLTSSASAGGGTSETLTMTGIKTTDTILGATLQTKGANAAALDQYESAAASNDKLAVIFTADPGAGAKVRAIISRSGTTTPADGTYTVTMDSTNTNIPSLLFLSGNAPTSYQLVLNWVLKPQEIPVQASA